eukprot:619648-Prorocentrum_minimum.AAC.1
MDHISSSLCLLSPRSWWPRRRARIPETFKKKPPASSSPYSVETGVRIPHTNQATSTSKGCASPTVCWSFASFLRFSFFGESIVDLVAQLDTRPRGARVEASVFPLAFSSFQSVLTGRCADWAIPAGGRAYGLPLGPAGGGYGGQRRGGLLQAGDCQPLLLPRLREPPVRQSWPNRIPPRARVDQSVTSASARGPISCPVPRRSDASAAAAQQTGRTTMPHSRRQVKLPAFSFRTNEVRSAETKRMLLRRCGRCATLRSACTGTWLGFQALRVSGRPDDGLVTGRACVRAEPFGGAALRAAGALRPPHQVALHAREDAGHEPSAAVHGGPRG